MSNFSVVSLEKKHVNEVIGLHISELNMGVLTYFGRGFLTRMYLSLLEKGNWGSIVCDKHNKSSVKGFVFAVNEEVSHIGCLRIQSILFFIYSICLRPSRLPTFLRALRKIYFNSNDVRRIEKSAHSLELAHFAVHSACQSRGLGGMLLQDFERRAKERGYSSVFTRTHNQRLVDFYLKTREARLISKNHLGDYDLFVIEWEI